NFFVARTGTCPAPTPATAGRRLRRSPSRSWFGPAAELGVHRTVGDLWAESFWRAATGAGGPERLALLRERSRLIPRDAAAWIALADTEAATGDSGSAARHVDRAIALDPDSPDA